MQRAVDVLSVVLLLLAIGAFAAGIHALSEREDLEALYFLVVGAVGLRSSIDLLRPRSGARG